MTRLSAVIHTPDPAFQASVTRLLRSLGASFTIVDERQASSVAPQIAVVDVRSGAALAQPSLERMRASWPSAVIVAVATTEQPEEILHAMRGGANEFVVWQDGDSASRIDTGLRAVLQRASDRLRASERTGGMAGRMLAFFGAKGGAGTTTLAVNSAIEIARTTKRPTLIIDLQPFLGQVALFLGVRPRFTLVDALDNLHRLDADFLKELVVRHQSGLDLLAGSELVDRPGPQDAAAFEHLLPVLARAYDFIVIDASSVVGACGETAVYAADTIYLVANPDVPSIRNTQRVIERMTQLGAGRNRVSVLLNRTSDQQLIAPKQIESALGYSIHHAFASDYSAVANALNAGVPLTLTNHSELSGQFSRFTRSMLNLPPQAEPVEGERRRGMFLGLF